MPMRPATNLKLDPATQARLRRHRSADGLMREAIDQDLEREEGREQFLQDAFAAWAEFQATGLHVTAAEADAWLARLAVGEDVEPPQPQQ